MKVVFGCGSKPLNGWMNTDLEPINKHIKKIDCNKPLPFKDNSVNEILCEHLIEHLDNPEFFMQEIWRISKNEARVIIEAPHSSNHIALGMLFHRTAGLSF